MAQKLHIDQQSETALLARLAGTWKMGADRPPVSDIASRLESSPSIESLTFDTQDLTGWDTSLLTFLIKTIDVCEEQDIAVDMSGLPEGVRRLLDLSRSAPARSGGLKKKSREPFVSRIGGNTVDLAVSARAAVAFAGDVTLGFARLVAGRASFRRSDLLVQLQQCGVQALPIVSLISLLVGLILAFVGAIQLRMFGAQIYLADLVGIAMVRVMGAVMTGVIMAGRTGARFAAEIGTMQVNEEIDALKTLGISPIDYLVVPRMIGLTVMMPLLCLYADVMGIIGGIIVGVGMFDLTILEYYHETKIAVELNYVWVGLIHAFVFGIVVAFTGCLRGMQCGRSATAVGGATTSAVVTSIVAIVIATAIITVLCEIVGV